MKIHINPNVLFLLLALILTSCRSSWKQPVPIADIIYQTNDLDLIMADGTQHQVLNVDRKFVKPTWSRKGAILYGLTGRPEDIIGYPAYWDTEKGSFKACSNNLPSYDQIAGAGNANNPYEVIVEHVYEIRLFDLDKCKKLQSFIDNNDNPTAFSIRGFSYYPLTQELLYGRSIDKYETTVAYQIVKLNIKNGKQIELGEGINPSWSPDGSQIAYIGLDGLHIMAADGGQDRWLIRRQFFDPWGIGSPEYDAPFLSWSPDGKWLVYHQCMKKICFYQNNAIFKLRIADGQEDQIIMGGVFPNWRQ